MPPTDERSQGSQQPGAHPEPTDDLSGTNTTDDQSQPTCPIEDLPAELRRKILFALANLAGLQGLGALVSASPVFFQLYRIDRKTLLQIAVRETLGNYVLEA